MKPYWKSESFRVYHGDCLEVMASLPECSVDAIVTDPPYGLSFMGKDWDHGLPGIPFWRAALRVAKPGCYLLAFGGTRTFHRLACAIEDAGWECRDTLMFLYGAGFPKSLSVSKAIDKAAGAEREVVGKNPNPRANVNATAALGGSFQEHPDITAPATELAKMWDGWGTALKPAWEPIILARKPLDGTVAENVAKWGCGALNIDGCRIGVGKGGDRDGEMTAQARYAERGSTNFAATPGPRGGDVRGRWPANVIHDGSEQVTAGFPVSKDGICGKRFKGKGTFDFGSHGDWGGFGGRGSAARFFYTAKASSAERGEGNDHPTVKPYRLMRYLCKLLKQPGRGILLDPFMGTGSTLLGARAVGWRAVGIELDEHYCEIAVRRLKKQKRRLGFGF
jgi:site-specific DNA-methyltransferase (adenine-specific)